MGANVKKRRRQRKPDPIAAAAWDALQGAVEPAWATLGVLMLCRDVDIRQLAVDLGAELLAHTDLTAAFTSVPPPLHLYVGRGLARGRDQRGKKGSAVAPPAQWSRVDFAQGYRVFRTLQKIAAEARGIDVPGSTILEHWGAALVEAIDKSAEPLEVYARQILRHRTLRKLGREDAR